MADDRIIVEIIEFFGIAWRWGVRVGFSLISGHLVSEGSNILVDLSGHGIFAGGLRERDSCAMLGEVGRFARRTLQATASDHDWDRTLLDEVVGGRAEQDSRRRWMSGRRRWMDG